MGEGIGLLCSRVVAISVPLIHNLQIAQGHRQKFPKLPALGT